MECPKVIVDCDAGCDDALALALLVAAHRIKKIQIIAITCVTGNTYVDNVVENVFRTLQICDGLDIPVHKGSCSPLVSAHDFKRPDHFFYHGFDGLGDIFKDKSDTSKLQEEHAVCALRRITSEFYGQVIIVCLGPLTNLALAIKMYPDFVQSVKKFFIMGGNFSAVGNITAHAEFNFYFDPESAYIFLSNCTKDLWILPWETCLKSTIPQKWRYNVLAQIDTHIAKFIDLIFNGLYSSKEQMSVKFGPCDALVAGILLKPEMVKEFETHHVDIELSGTKTRGQVLIDHLKINKPNANIIKDLNFDMFKDLLIFAMNPNSQNSKALL